MWLVGLGVWLILQDALIFTVPSGQLAGRTEGWRHVSNRQEGRRMPQPFGWAWAAEQLCCQPLLCQPQPALFSASEQADIRYEGISILQYKFSFHSDNIFLVYNFEKNIF